MNRLWPAARAGLFLLDPETAHEASLRALEAGLYPRPCKPDDARLGQTLFGLNFPNPIGVAAGYDKDARVYNALSGMGFGFVEAGTVTPRPQPGNPRPRVFRLIGDRAIVNRMGFNNAGHAAAQLRLASRPPKGILGINIGANRNSADPIADYVAGVHALGPLASYLAVNISSPNTPGLRDLQAPERLDALLAAVMEARASLPRPVPVLVKLAPDLDDEDIAPAMACMLAHKVDGAILTNTTLSRDGVSASPHRGEARRTVGAAAFRALDPLPRKVLSCHRRQAAADRRWRHRLRGSRAGQNPRRRVAGPALHRAHLHGPQPSVRYQIRPARGDRKERLFARQPRRNRGGALGEGLNKRASSPGT